MEPVRTSGGGLIMPDLPSAALTLDSHKERLNASSSWAELVLVDWFKRIAVFGVSASFDIERFERATQALARLTAVAKSVLTLDRIPGTADGPSAPTFPETALETPTSTPAIPSTPADPVADPSQPASPFPQAGSSADVPDTHNATPAPIATVPGIDSVSTPISTLAPAPSSSPRSELPAPRLSGHPSLPILTVRAVPACPTLSIEGIETFLARTGSDLAEATRPVPPVLDLPPTPPPSPSLSPHSALRTPHSSPPSPSSSPHSALRAPHSSPPSPSSSPHSALRAPHSFPLFPPPPP